MAKSLRCLVSGRVQGVFFRSFVLSQALSLGVNGYVRNKTGGDVEVVAQGKPEVLRELVERLHGGSPLAKVTSLRTMWVVDEPPHEGFHIRR
ncbi:acylphosphatase [Fundidesulfovibrio butyratiphilus]